ncbi:hypothetical protein BV25DRAFT_1807319 [Artomyces pyxidatus]|uniref:Uncharacterized protein n=1 Tax=Artomyces pyxidatus TaxID=48021 RepID=A0ACB8SWU5_9AGAM|nr:hypothetical protein BV25DRAFT_1807319 [Artomyces pyxidatus]
MCYPKQVGGKPVIYLQTPTHLPHVNIDLSLVSAWSFSALYPSTEPTSGVLPDGTRGQTATWTVSADPDGTLHDKATGSDVAYLFWEAQTNPPRPLSPVSSRPGTPAVEAFDPARAVLTAQDSVLLPISKIPAYLDSALKCLCLHTEARTSFITYWLPSLLKHQHVALRFLAQDAYEAAAPMRIVPTPEVMTRVFMLFRGVEAAALEGWEAARLRADGDCAMWKDVVGVDTARAMDTALFRVLEWGGMEVL